VRLANKAKYKLRDKKQNFPCEKIIAVITFLKGKSSIVINTITEKLSFVSDRVAGKFIGLYISSLAKYEKKKY